MCDKCNGTGSVKEIDFEPYGNTMARRESWFMCDCLMDHICPSCDTELIENACEFGVTVAGSPACAECDDLGENCTEPEEEDRLYCPNCKRFWDVD